MEATSPTTDALSTAEAALGQGDREVALRALLVAWRDNKASEIAQLIEVISEDLTRSLPALDPEGKEFHPQWMALEQAGRAGDVARLAPGLWSEPTSTLGLRLERLVARGQDPRTGRALLAMVEHIPTTSSSNFSVWVRAFKAMPTMIDAAAEEQLRAFRKRKPKTSSQFWPKFHGWIDKLLTELPAVEKLDKEAAPRVKTMLARARELARQKPTAPATGQPSSPTADPSGNASAPGPGLSLASATECLKARDLAGAVGHVLAAWTATPGPELEALLAKASAAAPQEELPAEPAKAVSPAWQALESKGRASDIPTLLGRLEVGTFAEVEARLARLYTRPADPRVSVRMRAIVREGKAGGEKTAHWAAVFDLLGRSGDASDLALVRRLGDNDGAAVGRGNLAFGNGPLLRRNGARVAPAMAERLAREPSSPLAPTVRAAIARVEALLPAPAEDPERAMIAAVVASPEDDGPRLVYADKLTELGSPRGELIVVQCRLARAPAPAERKKLETRQKALLKARGDLLGPLVDLIFKGSERFDRGMLVAMQPQLKSDRQRALLDHPMLATVQELGLPWVREGETAAVVLHPNLASLRSVHGLRGGDLPAVFGSPRPLPITEIELGMQGNNFSEMEREALAQGPGLPALRVLRGSFWDGDGVMPAWMMGGDLFARLDRLYIGFANSAQVPAIAAWLRAMRQVRKAPWLSLEWGGGACIVVDGVVRATNTCLKSEGEWNRALREARSEAKEFVLEREAEWPEGARAEIFRVTLLRIAQVVPRTHAEGPGVRFAVWVQGCPIRCAGCCNPQMFAEEGGTEASPIVVAREAAAAGVEGITLLGGEPFAQAAGCAELASLCHEADLSVMVFTGYTLAEIESRDGEPGVRALLDQADLLVDGRFELAAIDTTRRWIGSRNQTLHFRSPRYSPDDPRFRAPNTAEIRLTRAALTMNGWPGLLPKLPGAR